jgi:hypothetical protein
MGSKSNPITMIRFKTNKSPSGEPELQSSALPQLEFLLVEFKLPSNKECPFLLLQLEAL